MRKEKREWSISGDEWYAGGGCARLAVGWFRAPSGLLAAA